jgi:hypothetical protein
MDKKMYESPKLTKVRMVVTESVLSICHSSPLTTPATMGRTCSVELLCYEAPKP